MNRFGDGLAVSGDLVQAAAEATAQALAGLAGQVPDLLFAFVAGSDPEAVEAAGHRVWELGGAGATLGCSAGGVIGGAHGVEASSAVAVWAAVLPGAGIRTFHLEVVRGEQGSAVVGLPERQDGDEVVVLLADPWSFPTDGFVRQAAGALPGLPFVGGLAAGARPGHTRLLLDGRAVDRGAVGAVLTGTGARAVVSQGCRPVGPPMTVTRASANVVYELAGSPAVARVQAVLADLTPDEQALASGGLQLGIALDEYADEHERGDFLVRGILGTEPTSGGLVVGDLVAVGTTVRLQVRDADAADEELQALLLQHAQGAPPTGGALLFSCNGRGAHLFGPGHGGADHDARVVAQRLAPAGVAGFFAGGEIGPVGPRSHLHAFTAAVLTFPGVPAGASSRERP